MYFSRNRMIFSWKWDLLCYNKLVCHFLFHTYIRHTGLVSCRCMRFIPERRTLDGTFNHSKRLSFRIKSARYTDCNQNSKRFFQNLLALRLNLSRVSAPLFVDPLSGLNDNLNGIERPVTFDIKEQNGKEAEVVQSLAKWKRYALKKYGFDYGEGLYTDMNAIRRDEDTDNIHSIFVDQWDWEKSSIKRIEISRH